MNYSNLNRIFGTLLEEVKTVQQQEEGNKHQQLPLKEKAGIPVEDATAVSPSDGNTGQKNLADFPEIFNFVLLIAPGLDMEEV